jgi:predicted nucleotidyltransferase
MEFDIKQHTIFLTLTGSRVYGTFDEHSDYDYRWVAIPPRRYFLGCQARFDQHESSSPDDCVIFGINKFLKLAAGNNPNVVELLFIPARFWATSSPEWHRLQEARGLFISKKCFHTFRGYAHAQLKRVRGHRSWLLQGALQEPTREQFGLDPRNPLPQEITGAADALIAVWLQQTDIEEDLAEISRLDKSLATAFRQRLWEFLELHLGVGRTEIEGLVWSGAAKQLGYQEGVLELLQREKKFRQARRHYDSWLHWKAERNPKRREIEAKCGYDSKHLAHCLRLMTMCKEILTDGLVLVERPDADFLRGIRDGHYSFEELEALYQVLDRDLEALYQKSTLQSQPKRTEIEELGIELVGGFLSRTAG